MKTTTFICQLPQSTQNKIKAEITTCLQNEGYKGLELLEIVENAMSGRLVDLEETIDIRKYL